LKTPSLPWSESGELLTRVQRVFFNLTSAHTNDELQQLQSDLAPRLAAHSDNIYLNRDLFERVESLYNRIDELSLDEESDETAARHLPRFCPGRCAEPSEEQQRMRQINERISSLTTEFQEKVLEMTRERAVIVDDESMLDGLSSDRIAAAREAAQNRGYEEKLPHQYLKYHAPPPAHLTE
jgi:peptidyl-dipeptidase Dcp